MKFILLNIIGKIYIFYILLRTNAFNSIDLVMELGIK
jgi:hypothetical protein